MKRLVAIACLVLVLAAGFLLWIRARNAGEALHPAEVFRRQTSAAWSSHFSIGIVRKSPVPADPKTIQTVLETLRQRHVNTLVLSETAATPAESTALAGAARHTGIRLVLEPAWAPLPSDIAGNPAQVSQAAAALERFWTVLKPKPAAVILGHDLGNNPALPFYGRYGIAATTNRIPAFPTVDPDAAEAFTQFSPASPVLCCAMRLDCISTNPPDFNAFLEDGRRAVTAAAKAGMAPVFTIKDQGNTASSNLAWQLWASVALGAKGILHASGNPTLTQDIPPVFAEIAAFDSLLGRVEPCEDFLGLTPLLNVVYPGDMARLFYDPKKNTYLAAVVLSPRRVPGTPVTLRGGSLAPLPGSPPLEKLQPGHGGWYQANLPPESVAAMNEARSLTPLARVYRDELFIPTYGSRFTVLADKSMTPRMLYCMEPVAILVNPNILLEGIGGKGAAQPPARNYPTFRKAHVSGYTLHRIKLLERYRRLVILEEDGSTPGYNERVASLANVGVTNNGICPMPAKPMAAALPPQQCHLLYDLDAFRNISGLNPDYPLYFQFDGGNTASQQDTRFHVWAGPDADHMTERVTPRSPTPLVYLVGTDKWMKIGMPYNPKAETQPVLRRWSFFTWLRAPAQPAKR